MKLDDVQTMSAVQGYYSDLGFYTVTITQVTKTCTQGKGGGCPTNIVQTSLAKGLYK